MNITQSGLITSSRLDFTSNALYTRASSSSSSFMPTRDEAKSNHETDKQNEDNTTWFLEYKALLNSRLTTLITTLTNAYTTDLDSAMGTPSIAMPWGSKSTMQGDTGSLYDHDGNAATAMKGMLDPGAMRASYAYISTFNSGIASTSVTPANANSWYQSYGVSLTNNTEVQPGSYSIAYPDPPNGGADVSGAFTGTTTFVTSKPFELDRMEVNISVLNQASSSPSLPTYTVTKTDKPGMDPVYNGKQIGNNFPLSLYKFFEKPENMDLLRFGMFKDVYVVGTSSLPTGSQMQGSISLNWVTPSGTTNGYISLQQERFAAFYHS